jgi:hypothetical protein
MKRVVKKNPLNKVYVFVGKLAGKDINDWIELDELQVMLPPKKRGRPAKVKFEFPKPIFKYETPIEEPTVKIEELVENMTLT